MQTYFGLAPLSEHKPRFSYIPEGIRLYLKYVRETEPSPVHHIATSLAILSQVFGGANSVRYGSKEIKLNVYVGLIAESGFRKTEAIKLGMSVYNAVLQKNPILKPPMADITSNTALLQASDKSSKRKVSVITSDGEKSYTSIFIVASEFASFFRRRDVDMITLLTNLFDGAIAKDSFTYTTQLGGHFEVLSPYVVILMASTPEWLAQSLPRGSQQGGFTNRFLYFYSQKYHPQPFPQSSPDITSRFQSVVDHFSILSEFHSDISWTAEAQELFADWYKRSHGGVLQEPSSAMKSWTARLAVYLIKLAGLSAFADKRLRIEKRDLEFAYDIMAIARSGTIRSLRGVGGNQTAWIELSLLSKLLDKKREKVSLLCAEFISEISPRELRQTIQEMQRLGLLKYDLLKDEVEIVEEKAEKFVSTGSMVDIGWEEIEKHL